jgi:hypothetical protein
VNTLYSGLVTNATHTGEVTGSDALTITNAAVTYAKIQNIAALSVIGRLTNTSGVGAEVSAVAGGNGILRESGNTIGFGNIDLASSGAVGTSILQVANGGTGQSAVLVPGGVMYSSSTTAMGATVAGTAGQVLRSNGAGAPSWTNVGTGTVTTVSVNSANGLAGTVTNAGTTPAITLSTTINGILKGDGAAISSATAGTDYVTPVTLLNIRVLSSGTTYTPTAGTKVAKIELWGGGGAGGGVNAAAAAEYGAGGGGGSGGYALFYLTSVSGTYSYAIGGGGTGASGAVGGNGGNTTFTTGATTITAFGGIGGSYALADNTVRYMPGGAGGTISTNGTFNGAGQPGDFGIRTSIGAFVNSGNGGSTTLGGGGVGVNLSAAGSVAGNSALANTGSGGSGAVTGGSAAARAGGNGADGVIIIYEYK